MGPSLNTKLAVWVVAVALLMTCICFAGAGVEERLQLLSQSEAAKQPGMRAKRTAVFLDPSSRTSVLQW